MKHLWLLFLIVPLPAFADQLILSNVPNGCSSDFNPNTYFFATFTRSQYQCNSGYYVPANTDHCVLCPDVYDCNGGTFAFDEYIDQGNIFKTQITGNITNGCKEGFLRSVNNSASLTATFTPNTHTCAAGYYLPANTDGCVRCPENNYCTGGTYTFNETTTQGITQCASGLHAPAGMWESAQCGHKLHIGNSLIYLRAVKKTTPSLNIRFGNDVFFGNMTTTDVVMSSGATQKLKIRANGVVYSVYDDSVVPAE